MSKKFKPTDRDVFKTVYLSFSWMPTAHLAAMMRIMASEAAGILPEKWRDFHESTAHRWIADGHWQDEAGEVQAILESVEQPPQPDDEIERQLLSRTVQLADFTFRRAIGGVGDTNQNLRRFTELHGAILRQLAQRRSLPLTPEQLIDLFIAAGQYAAGKAFDEAKATEFLEGRFAQLRSGSQPLLGEGDGTVPDAA